MDFDSIRHQIDDIDETERALNSSKTRARIAESGRRHAQHQFQELSKVTHRHIRRLEEELAEARERNGFLIQSEHSNAQKLDELRLIVAERVKDSDRLRAALSLANTQLESKHDSARTLREENAQLANDLAVAVGESSALRDELRDLRRELHTLRKEIGVSQQRMESDAADRVDLKNEIARFTADRDLMREERDGLRRDSDRMAAELAVRREQIAQLQAELGAVSNETERELNLSRVTSARALKTVERGHKEKYASMELQLEEMRADKERQITQRLRAEEECVSLRASNLLLQDKVKRLKGRLEGTSRVEARTVQQLERTENALMVERLKRVKDKERWAKVRKLMPHSHGTSAAGVNGHSGGVVGLLGYTEPDLLSE